MGKNISLKTAPDHHPRVVYWLARAALTENDPGLAQAIIFPLAESGDAEALSILGSVYALQGQFGEAVSLWTQVGAYNYLISAAVEAKVANRLDDALLAFQAAFSIDSEEGAIPLAIFLLDSMNNPERSQIIILEAIQQHPNSVNEAAWCYLMGRIFYKEKNYIEADNWFARAITLRQDNKIYWITRANSVRDGGNLTHSFELYSQAIKQFPNYAPIYYELAWAYKLAGAGKESILAIEKAIRLKNPTDVNYEIRAGQVYENFGFLDKALNAYQLSQSIDPGIGTAPLVAYYRNSLKDNEKAISTLKQAITTYPEVTQQIGWMLQLAGMYSDKQLWSDATAVYQQVLEQDPLNIDALIGLGWAHYHNGGGLSVAQEEFQKAINAAPEDGEGYHAIGQLLAREKRYLEADKWFTEAIERSPEIPGWWVERGNSLRSAGSLEQAFHIYIQAIERFPNFASGYYELAWAYRLNNDKDQSIRAIENAIGIIATPNEWYYVRAGNIYEWVGSKEQAITAYNDALKLNPTNTSALDGLLRLNQ